LLRATDVSTTTTVRRRPRLTACAEVDLVDYFDFGDDARAEGEGQNFTYDAELTPAVLSISRTNGTTAGGTVVKLNVTGFGAVATLADVTVTIAGVVCSTTTDEVGDYRGQNLCDWDGVDCTEMGLVSTGRVDAASGANVSVLTCITNAWDYNGDAFEREVGLYYVVLEYTTVTS
jgi:hypothetical protein